MEQVAAASRRCEVHQRPAGTDGLEDTQKVNPGDFGKTNNTCTTPLTYKGVSF